jgi:RNA polymerase sigma factor (sigma-70 family)
MACPDSPKLAKSIAADVLVGADAEDVAAEAWLQIARDLAGFHGDTDGFRGWATTIARHRAMDHLRQRRRRPAVTDTEVDQLTELPGPADTAGSVAETIATRLGTAPDRGTRPRPYCYGWWAWTWPPPLGCCRAAEPRKIKGAASASDPALKFQIPS